MYKNKPLATTQFQTRRTIFIYVYVFIYVYLCKQVLCVYVLLLRMIKRMILFASEWYHLKVYESYHIFGHAVFLRWVLF